MAVAEGKVTASLIKTSDLTSLKAYLVLSNVVHKVFHKIYALGCEKPSTMTVREYLIGKKGMSNVNFKKYFNKSQISKMEGDSEGFTYDITLLYNCIQRVCNNVADSEDLVWKTPSDTFEYTLYSLKMLRNKLAHESHIVKSEAELNDFVSDVKTKIAFLFEEAGNRYSIAKRDVDTCILEYTDEIDGILSKFDNAVDVNKISDQLVNLRIGCETLVKGKGRGEVKNLLNQISGMNSSDVMSGFQGWVDVSDIFTNIDLVTVCRNRLTPVKVDVENLFECPSPNGVSPSVIIVEGVAGAGKTTLTKLIMSEWSKGAGFMKKVQQFELVLYMECRNTSITNMNSFLVSHMPRISCEMTEGGLIGAVLNMKVLVIVNGLDELNGSSRKLLLELLQKLVNHNMQMLITTRPDNEELYKVIPTNLEICHLKIMGVSPERRTEFILKFDRIMQRSGQNKQDATGLASFVKTTPWLLNLLSLPLNLVLITVLWVQSPERVQWLKSSTSLYVEILNLMKDRLVERLLVHEATSHFQKGRLNEVLSEYLQLMFRESLVAVKHENLMLSVESRKLLEELCLCLALPTGELFSAFFAVTGRNIEELEYPHVDFRDFYAALALSDCLKRSDHDEVTKSVSKCIHEVLIANKVPVGTTSQIKEMAQRIMKDNLGKTVTVEDLLKDLHQDNPKSFVLKKYQKVLIHLVGLLKTDSSMFDCYAVELVKLLKESGLKDSEQWMNILAETECNPNILAEVRRHISTDVLHVRDCYSKEAFAVLKDVEFQYIHIDISSDPCKLENLKDILNVLSSSHSQLKLTLTHHWQYPELGYSDDFLLCLLGKSGNGVKLTHFMGSVKSLSSLGKFVESLFVAIGSHYANNADTVTDYICHMNLEHLYIHITGGVSIDCLPDMPSRILPIDLWFSEIEDDSVEWVGKAVRKLIHGRRPFWSIRFPRSTLTPDGCIKLAKILKGVLIGKDGVMVSSMNLDRKDLPMIEVVFLMEISCSFHLSDEFSVWTFS